VANRSTTIKNETRVGSFQTHQWPQDAFAQIDPEDQGHVDRHVGAHVPPAIASSQVPDGEQAAEDEPAQRDDRERNVDVEDLLHEALVGVQRRVEEDQRERHADRRDGGERETSKAAPINGQN
jgi:hypothetical protein